MTEQPKAKEGIKYEIPLPEGVELSIEGNALVAKGEKGNVTRNLAHPRVTFTKKDQQFVLAAKKATKKDKRMMNTFRAHILNMVNGVKTGFVYKLKICSGHFPMTVKQEGAKIVITNFLGEKVARASTIIEGVKVDIAKEIITVESANKEDAAQTAANLEIATKISNRDRRVFQDGIYIIEKPKRVAK